MLHPLADLAGYLLVVTPMVLWPVRPAGLHPADMPGETEEKAS